MQGRCIALKVGPVHISAAEMLCLALQTFGTGKDKSLVTEGGQSSRSYQCQFCSEQAIGNTCIHPLH